MSKRDEITLEEFLPTEMENDRFTYECTYENDFLSIEMSSEEESMSYWDGNAFEKGDIRLVLKSLPKKGVYLAWMFNCEEWSLARIDFNPDRLRRTSEEFSTVLLDGHMSDFVDAWGIWFREPLPQEFADLLISLLSESDTASEGQEVELEEIMDHPDMACFIQRSGKRKRQISTWANADLRQMEAGNVQS
jgi:hypothetical protein